MKKTAKKASVNKALKGVVYHPRFRFEDIDQDDSVKKSPVIADDVLESGRFDLDSLESG